MSTRVLTVSAASLLLVGCGLAGTGGAAAVNGSASAEQAREAQQQMDKVRADVEAAQKSAADARAEVEAATQ
jgi:hypothetical protein